MDAAAVALPSATSLPAPISSDLTDALLEAAVDSIIVINSRGMIEAFNRSATRMFGYGTHEVLGRNISMLMGAGDASQHDDHLARHQTTGRCSIIGIGREVSGLRRDGSLFPMHLSVGEFRSEGRLLYVGICRDISERKRSEMHMRHLATHDTLTGCANRALFNERLRDTLERTGGNAEPQAAVLFVDLDRFKSVNDDFGHQMGDRVLATASRRMQACLETGDLLARVGGDEFAIVMHPASDERIDTVAACLIEALAAPIEAGVRMARIGASIGISRSPADGRDAAQLLKLADIAMYHAKSEGRGRFTFFTPAMHERMRQDALLASQLRASLDCGRFELHYQLQFRLDTLAVCGLEALIRWRDASGQLVAPDKFLPLAAEQGLMPRIGSWVLERACRDNRLLIERGLLDVPVAVNIGPYEFENADFVREVTQVLADCGLPGRNLELEMTEHAAVTDMPGVRQAMHALKALGVTLSLDDFGTGFSSLSYLKRFPFDRLKIDRSFISALPDSQDDAALTGAILKIADSLGMSVIAEGVETTAQRDFLVRNGCKLGQGYWFARPMPLPDIIARLSASSNQAPA